MTNSVQWLLLPKVHFIRLKSIGFLISRIRISALCLLKDTRVSEQNIISQCQPCECQMYVPHKMGISSGCDVSDRRVPPLLTHATLYSIVKGRIRDFQMYPTQQLLRNGSHPSAHRLSKSVRGSERTRRTQCQRDTTGVHPVGIPITPTCRSSRGRPMGRP